MGRCWQGLEMHVDNNASTLVLVHAYSLACRDGLIRVENSKIRVYLGMVIE